MTTLAMRPQPAETDPVLALDDADGCTNATCQPGCKTCLYGDPWLWCDRCYYYAATHPDLACGAALWRRTGRQCRGCGRMDSDYPDVPWCWAAPDLCSSCEEAGL